MGAPRVTKQAIERAINAFEGAGFKIGAVVVNNIDGTIRIERFQEPKSESVDCPEDDVQPSGPKKWGKG